MEEEVASFGDGLTGGKFILRTESRIICRMVFKNAFRNSGVLKINKDIESINEKYINKGLYLLFIQNCPRWL